MKFKPYLAFIFSIAYAASFSAAAKNNLYVEYLVVIDLGTYNFFTSLYGSNVSNTSINYYISTYYTQLINGVTFVFLTI